jgi:hypothetical protein
MSSQKHMFHFATRQNSHGDFPLTWLNVKL